MDYWPIVLLISTVVLGILTGKYKVQFERAKRIIKAAAALLKALDMGLDDDQVTEAEWRVIWAKIKEVLSA
jgi:copper homeostasis protein CutC